MNSTAGSDQATDIEAALLERYGLTQEQFRDQIKPLFMFIRDHGITSLNIDRDGNKCLVTIDGHTI